MEEDIDLLLDRLYRTEYRKLFLYAWKVVGDVATTEDLVQETYKDALQHSAELHRHPEPAAWLLVAMKYNIFNYTRKRQTYLQHFIPLASENLGATYDSKLRDEMVLPSIAEIDRRIRAALSESDLYLLRRIILEHATHAEVAKELGIRVNTCQKRLERIRKRLRPLFPEYFK